MTPEYNKSRVSAVHKTSSSSLPVFCVPDGPPSAGFEKKMLATRVRLTSTTNMKVSGFNFTCIYV